LEGKTANCCYHLPDPKNILQFSVNHYVCGFIEEESTVIVLSPFRKSSFNSILHAALQFYM